MDSVVDFELHRAALLLPNSMNDNRKNKWLSVVEFILLNCLLGLFV